MYNIKRQLIGKNDLLDTLTKESGQVYSKTLTFFWRTVRNKDLWLKEKSIKRFINSHKLHAHSADASVEAFFNGLNSWRRLRKSDLNSRPPKRRKFFYPVTWKNSAIKLKNGNLILSNGKITEPFILKNWKNEIPILALLRWTGKQYEMIFTYSAKPKTIKIKKENAVGIDLGQIHLACSSNGLIINGRYLRSIVQWRNKKQADFQTKISKTKKGSNRRKDLVKKKKLFLEYAKNKINDILHKLTTGLVLTQKSLGVNTLVVGDLTGYRLENDCGHTRNQENHSWSYGKTTFMLKYKCEKYGLNFVGQEESYTSKTCPACGNQKKMRGRDFICKNCGFVAHRDIVGAYNILQKYLGRFGYYPVVPEMAPGFGVRYSSNINVTRGFRKFLNSRESTLIYQQ